MKEEQEEKKGNRRNFFREAREKIGRIAWKKIETEIRKKTRHYIRPPGALIEAEFLVGCTRCGDCISACKTETIFPLGPHTGVAAGTPALDLLNKGCTLCEDFPCITSCEPQVLQPIKKEEIKFAQVSIDATTCLPFQGPECGVCVSVCPIPGAITLDRTRPKINPSVCTGCALCRQYCVVSPSTIPIVPLE